MKLGWGAWKLGRWALLSVGLAALIANRVWIVDALKTRFPGKGLWDYLEILLVPVLLFGVGVLLDSRSKARDAVQRNEAEARGLAQRNEAERIRQEENRDQALQLYFGRVSSILLDKQVISLAEAAKKLGPEYKDPLVESARDVIRAQTLAILRVFAADEEKKSSVVRFLIESELLSSLTVSLSGANLRGADLRGADLSRAQIIPESAYFSGGLSIDYIGGVIINLSQANLSEANLSFTQLIGANLKGADLSRANLRGADLSEANLSFTQLIGANLFGATLRVAILFKAKLIRANLFGANLFGADLSAADLSEAKLIWANLRWANLNGADLEGVRWDQKTSWPSPDRFEGAKNIPPGLKKQLGL